MSRTSVKPNNALDGLTEADYPHLFSFAKRAGLPVTVGMGGWKRNGRTGHLASTDLCCRPCPCNGRLRFGYTTLVFAWLRSSWKVPNRQRQLLKLSLDTDTGGC